MKAELRKELEKVINATINGKPNQANEAFHNYIKAKTKSLLSESKKPMRGKKGVNPFADKYSASSKLDDKTDSHKRTSRRARRTQS
jgi:hypothetical protein